MRGQIYRSALTLLDPCFDPSYDDIIDSVKRSGVLEPSDSVASSYDNNDAVRFRQGWTPERRQRAMDPNNV